MKKYAVNGPSASASSNHTALTIISSSSIRSLISEFSVGILTAPNATDQQVNFQAAHWTTSAGTAGSSPTPKPLDMVDPVAAVCTAGITHSGEPTYDSTTWYNEALNQRGLFRWVSEIGFELGSGAVATTGFGIQMIASTSNLQLQASTHYKE